jgi:hypothetical protein
MKPIINGKIYGWADISFVMLDRTVRGITAIEYKEAREKEMLHGAGAYPIGYGIGRYKAEASVTLYKFEVDALHEAAASYDSILDLPLFDIIIQYNDASMKNPVTEILRNCSFTNNAISIKEGDIKAEVKLDLIVSHIEKNTK